MNQFLTALKSVARPAYIPQVSQDKAAPTGSRYFGQPWLPLGVNWPVGDGQPLRFVLQLNTAELPAPWGASVDQASLISFFYDVEIDESVIFRSDLSQPGDLAQSPEGVRIEHALTIARWQSVTDYPWMEDFEEVFGEEADAFSELVDEVGSSTVGQLLGKDGEEYPEVEAIRNEIAANYHCFECDKLGGWPRWEQYSETPEDSEGNPMSFLFQVGFEGVLLGDVPADLNWPTWGRGQIFMSEATGEFEYVWACD